MKKPVPLGERLRYGFDKSMAAGPIALIGWLALVSLVVVILAGVVLAVTGIAPEGSEPLGIVEGSWEALMRTLDSGTMGGDVGWGFRIVMFLVTLAGIFIVSALIGVINNGLEGKLSELRKGRSRVLEGGHTIILNWSPSIFDIISELAIANESERRPRIVIMATKDKVEMEDEVAAKVANMGKLRVICRSGDPTDLYDLSLVSPEASKSIIVLSPEGDDPDSQVVKTVLALVHDPKRRAEPYQIAAEIRDAKNADVARIVGGKEVQLVLADELISRIVVHSSRQSGLSAVYSELLDFDGCEIYTTEQKELVGKTYGEALIAYESCALMGLCDPDGKVKMNPAHDTVITAGSRAIIIAEDDAAIRMAAVPAGAIDTGALRTAPPREREAERTLILGWNRRGPMIAFELSRYVAPGSLLTVIADTPDIENEIAEMPISGENLKVECRNADSANRAVLMSLDIPSYDHVMVLGYSDVLPAQSADTRTLVTLLHLRRIADTAGQHIGVVSEMADVRNRELAEVTRTDDFVVSNKLVSLMLAQASENEFLSAIFDDLLDEEGSEIYMRAAEDYVALGQPVNFYTVTEAARRRGESALGYARRRNEAGDDPRRMGGVVVNPSKSEKITYQPGDRIVVLAED
jgi:voltage-gated potassium channel Kch